MNTTSHGRTGMALVIALMALAVASEGRAQPPAPSSGQERPADCVSQSDDRAHPPENFRLDAAMTASTRPTMGLPVAPGVIDDDVFHFLSVRYPTPSQAHGLRDWIAALACHGWQVVSQGLGRRFSQAWLTHPTQPETLIVTAKRTAQSLQVQLLRTLRNPAPTPSILPPSLSQPPLAPLADPLLRHETSDNVTGRHLLHVAYPLSSNRSAILAAWTDTLVARGWVADSVAGQRHFSGPDGTVMLDVWRGPGSIELNLHRIAADDPRRELWGARALAILGVPTGHDGARTSFYTEDFQSVVRCSQAPQSLEVMRGMLADHDRALVGLGWIRSSPAPATLKLDPQLATTLLHRRGHERLATTVTASGEGFCHHVTSRWHRALTQSQLGPVWQDDDWIAMAGPHGDIVASTNGTADEVAVLEVAYRRGHAGKGSSNAAVCANIRSRLLDQWSRALRNRGWVLSHPPEKAYLARREQTLVIQTDCDDSANVMVTIQL